MVKRTVHRIISTSTYGQGVMVSFIRRCEDTHDINVYLIHTENLSEFSLSRLDRLSYQARRTTVMHFKDYILTTSVFAPRTLET